MKKTYRGYLILYHQSDGWLAFLYPPGRTQADGEIERATRKQGNKVLLKRVYARIDEELEREEKTPP